MNEAGKGFDHGRLPIGWNIEQQESAAARTGQLSADSPGPSRGRVHIVDVGIRNDRTEASLGLPRLVKQFAEFDEIAIARKDGDAFVDEVPSDAKLTLLFVQTVAIR